MLKDQFENIRDHIGNIQSEIFKKLFNNFKLYNSSNLKQSFDLIYSKYFKECELKCSCGASLYEYNKRAHYADEAIKALHKEYGYPRSSKKKRLRKKFAKEWEKKVKTSVLLLDFSSLMFKTSFYCKKCNRFMGFYETIGRNMIQIEPMPEGAKSIY